MDKEMYRHYKWEKKKNLLVLIDPVKANRLVEQYN